MDDLREALAASSVPGDWRHEDPMAWREARHSSRRACEGCTRDECTRSRIVVPIQYVILGDIICVRSRRRIPSHREAVRCGLHVDVPRPGRRLRMRVRCEDRRELANAVAGCSCHRDCIVEPFERPLGVKAIA